MRGSGNLLILYSEYMPYNIPVWRALQKNSALTVHVVHWDHKKLTPYRYSGTDIQFYERSKLNDDGLMQLSDNLNPVAVVVSGRMDKGYLIVANKLRKNGTPVVMGSDKQWTGSLRDYLAVAMQRWLYHRYFTHAWVPGDRQRKYVKMIGFPESKTIGGLYIGDIELFSKMGTTPIEQRQDVIFVGRLERIKGIQPLIDVLMELRNEGAFQGRLWIFGNGSLSGSIPKNDWIKYRGFAAQTEIQEAINHAAIFCLPSLDEPWGVVVHEQAAAGLLICCSQAVGSADHFVQDQVNGVIFPTGNWNALKKSLVEVFNWSPNKKTSGSELSRSLAKSLNSERTASELLSALQLS
ncbi:MAG: glycosyltransferase [Bacteroidetes bacterium]|nr:glycosyltransferase [Bacteroidota bacterium]